MNQILRSPGSKKPFLVLNQIRKETQAKHRALELTTPFNGLLENSNPRQQLLDVVNVLSFFHRKVLIQLTEFLPREFTTFLNKLKQVRTIDKKAHDDLNFAAPNQSANTEVTKFLSPSDNITNAVNLKIDSEEAAIGVFYVLFGSARGAKTILLHVNRNDNLSVDTPALLYFNDMQRLANNHFLEFVDVLESAISTSRGLDVDMICKAANNAFDFIICICTADVFNKQS